MMPTMGRINPTTMLATAAVFALLFGCSTPNPNALIDPETGRHPANWLSVHPDRYKADNSLCAECHGTDLQSGISGVSCFSAARNGVSCHANGPAGHPANWASPSLHGASAKLAPTRLPIAGFSICQLCHGSDFRGGSAGTPCFSCHGVNAPHPASWLPGDSYQHISTDPSNAPVCAQCHANGANSPIAPPSPPAPAGAAPGCFNNTLCHGPAVHPAGWSDPAQHGVHAKAAPDPSTVSGFSTCQACHGSNLLGAAGVSCLSCHTSAPHPTSWLPDSRYQHNTTNQANASVCALCHANGANSPIFPPFPAPAAGTPPGCLNGTLCHYVP